MARKRGSPTPVVPTPEWIDLVRAAMAREGLDQTALGEAIRSDQTTVSRMLAGKPTTIASAVAARLQLPEPQFLISDSEEQAWHELGRALRRNPGLYASVKSRLAKIVDGMDAESELGHR